MRKIALILSGFTSSLVPLVVFAQRVTDVDSLFARILRILNRAVPVIVAIAVVWFLWSVFQYAIAGDEEKKAAATKNMIYGIIAIFVMVSVWGLVRILVNTFGLENVAPNLPFFPVL